MIHASCFLQWLLFPFSFLRWSALVWSFFVLLLPVRIGICGVMYSASVSSRRGRAWSCSCHLVIALQRHGLKSNNNSYDLRRQMMILLPFVRLRVALFSPSWPTTSTSRCFLLSLFHYAGLFSLYGSCWLRQTIFKSSFFFFFLLLLSFIRGAWFSSFFCPFCLSFFLSFLCASPRGATGGIAKALCSVWSLPFCSSYFVWFWPCLAAL